MTEREQLDVVRHRLAVVEQAAENLLDVFTRTGEERKAAADALLAVLTTDFLTSVICSPDMTDAQRAEWLESGEVPS